MKGNQKKNLAYFGIILIFTGLFSYIFILANSYSINPLLPISTTVTNDFFITYPPQSSGQLLETMFVLSFNLESDGLLSEGVNMSVTNLGGRFFSKNFAYNVSKIYAGFEHAFPLTTIWDNRTGEPHTYVGPYPIWLEPNYDGADEMTVPIIDGKPSETIFYFPSAGTYHPTLVIALSNNSYLVHTYNEIDLPILSKDELRSQLFDQINVFIAIALLVFTFIEVFKIVHKWNPKDDNEKNGQCELPYFFER